MSDQQTEADNGSGISFLAAAALLAVMGLAATILAMYVAVVQNTDFFLTLIVIYAWFTIICVVSIWLSDKPWVERAFIAALRWVGNYEEDDETKENLHD